MKTFDMKLICVNCGRLADYQIPVNRLFADYRPEFDTDGNRTDIWSAYTNPKQENEVIVFCNTCRVPTLVRAPITFQEPPVQLQGASQL